MASTSQAAQTTRMSTACADALCSWADDLRGSSHYICQALRRERKDSPLWISAELVWQRIKLDILNDDWIVNSHTCYNCTNPRVLTCDMCYYSEQSGSDSEEPMFCKDCLIRTPAGKVLCFFCSRESPAVSYEFAVRDCNLHFIKKREVWEMCCEILGIAVNKGPAALRHQWLMRGILKAWSQLLGVFLASLSCEQGFMTARASFTGEPICTFCRLSGLKSEDPFKRALEDIRKDIKKFLGISAQVELILDESWGVMEDRDMFIIETPSTARIQRDKQVKKLKNLPLQKLPLLPSPAGPQTGISSQLVNAEDS